MNLVFDRIGETAEFVQSRLGTVLCPPYTTLGLEKNGRLVGGWMFHHYNGYDVEISVALDAPLLPGTIRAVKHYLFKQLRVRRVTGKCRETNTKSAQMMRRLGFHYEGRSPFYFGEDAAMIFGYTNESN